MYTHANTQTHSVNACVKTWTANFPEHHFSKMKFKGLSLMPQVFDDFQFLSASNKVSVPKMKTH
jgi:hypothetical protein